MTHSSGLNVSLRVAVGLVVAALFVPLTASAQNHICGAFENGDAVMHFDKIVFGPVTGKAFKCPIGAVDPHNAQMRTFYYNDLLDIKVPDDPNKVADLYTKVADKMGVLGCTMQSGATIKPVHIALYDVTYAIACGRPNIIE